MPRSFVCDVLLLIEHLRSNYNLDVDAVTLLRSIESEIDTKLEALRKRDTFHKYKSAHHCSDEREKFRTDYLDLAHIHKDWRSPTETFFS